MGQPNSHGGKSQIGIYGSTKLSWWEESNRHLWGNQTLMVGRIQQTSIGQPKSHGGKSLTGIYGQPNSHGGKSLIGIYGSTELSWWEESNRHLLVNQNIMVRRV